MIDENTKLSCLKIAAKRECLRLVKRLEAIAAGSGTRIEKQDVELLEAAYLKLLVTKTEASNHEG